MKPARVILILVNSDGMLIEENPKPYFLPTLIIPRILLSAQLNHRRRVHVMVGLETAYYLGPLFALTPKKRSRQQR